jgi:hypothetical protein
LKLSHHSRYMGKRLRSARSTRSALTPRIVFA